MRERERGEGGREKEEAEKGDDAVQAGMNEGRAIFAHRIASHGRNAIDSVVLTTKVTCLFMAK